MAPCSSTPHTDSSSNCAARLSRKLIVIRLAGTARKLDLSHSVNAVAVPFQFAFLYNSMYLNLPQNDNINSYKTKGTSWN